MKDRAAGLRPFYGFQQTRGFLLVHRTLTDRGEILGSEVHGLVAEASEFFCTEPQKNISQTGLIESHRSPTSCCGLTQTDVASSQDVRRHIAQYAAAQLGNVKQVLRARRAGCGEPAGPLTRNVPAEASRETLAPTHPGIPKPLRLPKLTDGVRTAIMAIIVFRSGMS
jgi:hypothetical protein